MSKHTDFIFWQLQWAEENHDLNEWSFLPTMIKKIHQKKIVIKFGKKFVKKFIKKNRHLNSSNDSSKKLIKFVKIICQKFCQNNLSKKFVKQICQKKS
jgi:hypothetical protein